MAWAGAGLSGEPKKGDQKLPFTLTLKAKETKVKLDLGGKTAAEFQKALDRANTSNSPFPAGPKVDLVAELKNVSDKDVTVWVGGSMATSFTFDVKGPAARNYYVTRFFTRLLVMPKPVTLAPGKTHTFGFKNLKHGMRGVAQEWFWTQPGEYTLTVRYNTAISPAPPGSRDAGMGFGQVSITSTPITIQVQEK
jgi:hypothetical protein